jgi:homoserine O-succinyltransferase
MWNPEATALSHAAPDTGDVLRIGLLNNMPRKAVQPTEHRIAGLLAAATGRVIRLRCFALGSGGASQWPLLGAHYEPLESLLGDELDGLIVTGAVPVAESVQDEPAWPGLAQVVDWASRNTVSTIWSCLAAQAAVFRLDGVPRRRLPDKLSGVFACEAAGDHPLLSGMPQRWTVPHSRWNDIDAGQLAGHGYTILSHGERIGADLFTKPVGRSQFLFIQGHPEYGPDCLYREYRRDVRQFIRGERASHPALPEAYFDPATADALAGIQRRTEDRPNLAMLSLLDEAAAGARGHAWHEPAVQLYRGWLAMIAARRAAGAAPQPQRRSAQC